MVPTARLRGPRSPVSNVAPSVRTVAWSGFFTGSLVALAARRASWSPSVLVCACAFRCPQRARRFASLWARRLDVPVRVRRGRRFWSVAVPVHGIPGQPQWAWVAHGAPGSMGLPVTGGPIAVIIALSQFRHGRGNPLPPA
jgi:hypothetical protein